MKKIFCLLLIMNYSARMVSAERDIWYELKLNEHSFFVKLETGRVEEKRLEKHFRKISAILNGYKRMKYQKGKRFILDVKDSIRILKMDYGYIKYRQIEQC